MKKKDFRFFAIPPDLRKLIVGQVSTVRLSIQTKPKFTDEDPVMNKELSGIQRKGKHLNNFEDVSDLKDMEEGEIREFDNPEVSHIKAETACPIPSVKNEVNPF